MSQELTLIHVAHMFHFLSMFKRCFDMKRDYILIALVKDNLLKQ